MFQTYNLRVELSDKVRAVGAGGIGLVHRLAEETGLIDAIDRRLHLLMVHRPYHESDHVLNLFEANDRCDQENLIAQLAGGVRALSAPVDNLLSNWAYMVTTALAWNLRAWRALWLPEEG